jgi:hypothetical protein
MNVEVKYRENIDYIIVINGNECPVEIIDPNKEYPSNVHIIRRDNVGYDFGGHYSAIKYINNKNINYDYYFFINSGMLGPVLTDTVWQSEIHWSNTFINKITNDVKLVGTTITCPRNRYGEGPQIESFFFVTDEIGLNIILDKGTIICNHKTKESAIFNGEYKMALAIINSGYNIDCMLTPYSNIDWRDKKNWDANNNEYPSRRNSFLGNSINPYEVIFHKWFWHDNATVNYEIIESYVRNFIKNPWDISSLPELHYTGFVEPLNTSKKPKNKVRNMNFNTINTNINTNINTENDTTNNFQNKKITKFSRNLNSQLNSKITLNSKLLSLKHK